MISFSHAPGFIHPIITPSGIIISLGVMLFTFPMLAFYLINFKSSEPSKWNFHQVFVAIWLISFFFYLAFTLLSTINADKLHDKFFNYYLSYVWFYLAILIFLFLSKVNSISAQRIIKILSWILFFNASYCFLEYVAHFFFIDIGSFIPRVDRINYYYNHPIFGYRVRGFNYESANMAYLANVLFTSIFILSKKVKNVVSLTAIFCWFIILFLTWSSVAIVVALPIVVLLGFYQMKGKYYKYFAIPVFVFVLLLVSNLIASGYKFNFDGFYIIVDKFLGYIGLSDSMVSANIRNDLLNVGLNAMAEKPFLGFGLSGFYFVSETGLNNLFVMLGVQLGMIYMWVFIMSYVISILFVCFYGKFIEAYLLLMNVVFLWFVSDFWLPQIFLSFFIVSYSFRQGLVSENKYSYSNV